MAETFSISDLAREFSVTTRAIRFYEDKGLLSPERQGQRRIYSSRDRVRLKLILRGKRLGFPLREIGEILGLYDADPSSLKQLRHLLPKIAERREQLQRQQADITAALGELEDLERRCREVLGDGKG